MNHQITTSNNGALTMSSRDFEAEAKALADGTAPNEVAYETALKAIAYAASLAGDFDTSDLDWMSKEDARKALDRIESGRTYLRGLAPLFDKYPIVKSAVKDLIGIMFYAEATLIPFYLMGNSEIVAGIEKSTKTYIVKHPTTGLLKIGRSVDVDSRVKSLQTGAGAILSVAAVMQGDRESELHKRFSHLRGHGEWFSDDGGEIQSFIERLEVA
jgi:hypothetical protein